MNRGVNYQSSLVQHMMGANPNSWWNMSNLLMPSPDQQTSAAEPSSASSHPMTLWSDSQEQLPESWSQLLLGSGLVMGHEDKFSLAPFVSRQMENWEDEAVAYSLTGSDAVGEIKQESSESGYLFSNRSAEDAQTAARASWGHQTLPASSPRSCITTSFGDNVLDFSNVNKGERRQHQSDHSSECNNSISTGAVFKKARVQCSPSPQPTFKVRKEKLGDRITALHQLVSPFGKTDTASVLLEAIGYIRFLQGQIQVLSSPYLARAGSAGNLMQQPLLDDNCMQKRGPLDQADSKEEPKKDLRSRGLCLVPLSCTLHVGSENGADYWAPNFGTGLQ